MDENDKTPTPEQVCSIRIMFPVNSDEQAIDYKKKIGEVLANIPQARVEFNLTTMPTPNR